MHHGGLGADEAQRPQRHVAVEEAALVDQSEDVGLGYGLVAPIFGPVVEHVLRYVARRVIRTEEEFFCFAADEDEPEVDLIRGNSPYAGHFNYLKLKV